MATLKSLSVTGLRRNIWKLDGFPKLAIRAGSSATPKKRKKTFDIEVSSWESIVKEAKTIIKNEPFMVDMITDAIVSKKNFADCMTNILAGHFASGCTINKGRWLDLIGSVYHGRDEYEIGMGTISQLSLLDLNAVRERDPACEGLQVHPILNFKGYKALQSHRIAHVLWKKGRKDAARAVQARCAEVFNVDIHPAATIGPGLMLDHATGLVVGETTVIGKNCSFLHGVTLGATGKEHGDRHPKIGNDVLIGCNVTVLGNITIEDSVSIGSGSIVLKPLPAHSTAVGNPARIIGASRLISPAKEMDTALNFTDSTAGVPFKQTWSTFADGSCVFTEADTTKRGKIDRQELAVALTMRFGIPTPDDLLDQLFQEGDADKDGYIDKEQFELISSGVKAFKKLAKNRTYEAGDGV